MEISFSSKYDDSYDILLILLIDGKTNFGSFTKDDEVINAINNFTNLKEFKKNENLSEEFLLTAKKGKLRKIHICKTKKFESIVDIENFSGKKFSQLERKKDANISVLSEDYSINGISNSKFIGAFASGFNLKNYSFRKYRSKIREIKNSVRKITFLTTSPKESEKDYKLFEKISKGVFLTRNLVSEPANELYPEKFVDDCKILAKAGIELEIFDEKKLKKLGMRALLGVAQGSVRPARVLVMKWMGSKNKNDKPLAFVGKGVTFDTGGISIKPSGGMEDMKWDMGGAAVVSGLLYSLALRKAKANVIGIVGLVENMPDGNAQRPGDIVKSMSGQTIEVLNTDAEGRLVLADILWYVNKTYKPELIVDLATLTGAIIVALGDRYAGLFSNSDSLANKLLKASINMKELLWRLPLDSEFDKLLNCNIADMKNITGTRGAGSITAAQFLQRFVGNTKWAHLDIAGVTWSNKGTALSRSGGTGFGVRLLDNFVKENYE